MNVDRYYSPMDERLKDEFLVQTKRRGISYRTVWKQHYGSFFRGKSKIHKSEYAAAINNSLFIFDFCLIWFSDFSSSLVISIIENSSKSEKDLKQNAMALIAWRAMADFVAIRRLVMEGFDVQAKQILRSASENLDALFLAKIDSQFAQDFIENQDVELTNKVWHKYISKGKARKSIYNSHPMFSSKEFREFYNYIDEEETVLSAASHPSFVSGIFSIFPDFSYDDKESSFFAFERAIPKTAIRTLNYAAFRLLNFILLEVVVFSIYDEYLAGIGTKSAVDFSNNIKILKNGASLAVLLLGFLSGRFENEGDHLEAVTGLVSKENTP